MVGEKLRLTHCLLRARPSDPVKAIPTWLVGILLPLTEIKAGTVLWLREWTPSLSSSHKYDLIRRSSCLLRILFHRILALYSHVCMYVCPQA